MYVYWSIYLVAYQCAQSQPYISEILAVLTVLTVLTVLAVLAVLARASNPSEVGN